MSGEAPALGMTLAVWAFVCMTLYWFAKVIPADDTPAPEPQPERGTYTIRLRLDHEGRGAPIADSTTAHRGMQLHRNCDRHWCASKRDAYRWLVDNGELTPDSSRFPNDSQPRDSR
ncbi:hypothetical protein [Nocardia sp. BMG51109]|uniref:hypothetical protein n=1 Tax=Nocardia sp. BMG51109 TaxID=1056816 RepID=UPI00046331CE|nr:hypothetical protein [Nocardia sp. BMG51109]